MLRRELERSLSDAAERIDAYSVLPKDRIRGQVQKRLRRLGSVRIDNAAYGIDGGKLSRRRFLQLLGVAGVGAVVGVKTLRRIDGIEAPTGYATHPDDCEDEFEVIEVGAGDTWIYNMDDGETLENLLIDITAPGASWEVRMHGRNQTLRNLGIRGQIDFPDKFNHISVSGGGGGNDKRIEHVYLDGMTWETYVNGIGTGGSATPIFVSPNHAGDLLIQQVNLRQCLDNLIYGSGPGNPTSHPVTGANGTVRIYDSFGEYSNAGCFRIGTDTSYCENVVAMGGTGEGEHGSRAFWGFYNHTTVRGCDFSDSTWDIAVGAGYAEYAEVTAEDTYWETEGFHDGGQTIHGTPADREPRTSPEQVEGVPLSPEEAACGVSGEDLPDRDEPDDLSEEDDDDGPGSYPLPDDPEPAEDPIPPWERELEPPC